MRREEYEQRVGKTLDEDVKIGVILALAPPQVQNHCHLNSHILKSYAQFRTMLFDSCRAQAHVVPMALSMLGEGKGKKGKGDKNVQGKGKKGEGSKDEKDKDEDKKGKGKGKANAIATEYFAGYCLSARPRDT